MSALTPLRFGALLLLLEVAYSLIAVLRAPHWATFLMGDSPYYAWVTESLVRDGDWDLSNQLPGDLKDHNSFFALSNDNRVVPKHSTLLPLLALPFFVVFGKAGFLVFNLLQVFALILGVAVLAGNTPAARLLALVGYLSTPFLAYTYNFSPDVLGAALVVWSFIFLQRNRPIAAGLLAGLSVWAKVYLALVLLPLGLLLLPGSRKSALRFAVAAIVAVSPMLIINAYLFSAPWISGYDREATVTLDGIVVAEHYSRFNQPFVAGLGNLLFDSEIGMLRTAPLWFLWPVGLLIAFRESSRPARLCLAAMALAIVINVLVFACYDEWKASVYGNRFLFPALALGIAVQGPMWTKALARRRRCERARATEG
jgi:hypothetical protein